MSDFNGAKIGLLEARMSGELARLIEKNGGVVISAPALHEETIDCRAEISEFIDKLASGQLEIVIFQTGIGISALLNEAEKLDRKNELIELLNKIVTICRGPKPTAVCGRNGIRVIVQIKAPWTTTELIAALSGFEIEAKKVGLLHYGERNQVVTEYLRSRGVNTYELLVYQWRLPESTGPLRNLIKRIISGEIDAAVFTSQIQARHLFQIAREMNLEDELRRALQSKIVVASIGPTCSAALRSFEVEPGVEPEHPKMAHLVQSLTKKFE